MKRWWLVGGAVVLAGCQSMSENQCRVADWQTVGQNDGEQGRVAASWLQDYAKDCAKVGVTPDGPAYRRGWDRGIVRFCVPERGWREGSAGRRGFGEVCVGQPQAAAFGQAYESGLRVHDAQSRLDRAVAQTKSLEDRLAKAKSDDERFRLRRQILEQDREQFEARRELQLLRLSEPRY